jgi:hypothetical protein
MKAVVAVIFVILGLAAAISVEQQKFLEFQKKYNRVYSSHEEFQFRYQVFKV